MLVNDFDDLIEAQPFHPFRLFMADGRSILVRSPEFAWHPPAGRTVFIATAKGTPRVHMIDLHLVTRFMISGGSNGSSGRSKRRPKK